MSETRVLLIEDQSALARTYCGFLEAEPYHVEHVDTGGEALAKLSESPAAVLLDLKLPDMDGFEILEWIRGRGLDVPVIVITAHGSMQTAIEAMRAGAADFLVKPFAAERLKVTLRNVLEKQSLTKTVETYRERIDRSTFHGFIGSSLPMQAVYRAIESAASSEATVFLTGESGTGKEVAARAVHDLSERRGEFVPVNCAAIPRDLMESEIFGHVKGAFTGAIADREGAARRAHEGTLFLDEICELEPSLQAKLLRFLQTGQISRIGGDVEDVDVRIICATNRNPTEEVRSGRFREDLYYRLHVIPIDLPALRERGDDVVEIATHFFRTYAEQEGRPFEQLDESAQARLKQHSWPGNVRELQNVVRNTIVMHHAPVVGAAALAAIEGNGVPQRPTISADRTRVFDRLAEEIRPLAEVERQAIERALSLCEGDIRKASVFLEIAPATIYRKLKSWRSRAS